MFSPINAMHDAMTSNMFNSSICISLTRHLEDHRRELSFSRIENYFTCRLKKAYTVRVTSYTRHNDAVSWSETQKHKLGYFTFQITAIN